MSKNIYALLVAINDYQGDVPPLSGCINDAQYLASYLSSVYEEADLHLRLLFNEEATRQNIISAFSHFHQAEAGDTCLFFYAGHGGQIKAPEAFWHIEPDRLSETLVCYDSRGLEGRDLVDKELSHLIWEATNKRDAGIHFVGIMDCCHSGTIFRDVKRSSTTRNVGRSQQQIPVEAYYGFDQYQALGNGALQPKKGEYVMLSAVRAIEEAQEIIVDGQTHGAFTYFLLEALQQQGRYISYVDLMNRVNIRIKQLIDKQSPQLETTKPDFKRFLFLNTEKQEEREHFLAYYMEPKGWQVNAGAVMGIQAGDIGEQTIFRSIQGGEELTVTTVMPAYSYVEAPDHWDKAETYEVFLLKNATQKLLVAFAENNDQKGEELLRPLVEESPHLKLVKSGTTTFYVIAKDNQYFLSFQDQKQLFFRPSRGFNMNRALDFIENLEKFSKWRQLQTLINPKSTIKESDFQLEFYRVIGEAENMEMAEAMKIENLKEPVGLPYTDYIGDWKNPHFRLKIRNTSRKHTLWVSALYLSFDYGVTNILMPKEEIPPGGEAWLSDYDYDGQPLKTIGLQLEDNFFEKGIGYIREQLKLILATEEFDTDFYNQEGISTDEMTEPKRGLKVKTTSYKSDWVAKDVQLEIHRPHQILKLIGGQPQHIQSLKITLPEMVKEGGVSMSTYYQSVVQATPTDVKISTSLEDGTIFKGLTFTNPFNQVEGLSVLEFHHIEPHGLISKEHPIIISFREALLREEKVVPIQYYPLKGLMQKLDHRFKENQLFLYELPEAAFSWVSNKYVYQILFHLSN